MTKPRREDSGVDFKARADRRVKEAIDRIIRGYQPKKVILHGSFARGDYHEGSDIDLIIIKDTSDRFADRIEKVLEFCTGEVAVQPLFIPRPSWSGCWRRATALSRLPSGKVW